MSNGEQQLDPVADSTSNNTGGGGGTDPSKIIYLIAACATVIFTFIYYTLHKRSRENNEDAINNSNGAGAAGGGRARTMTDPPEEDEDDDEDDENVGEDEEGQQEQEEEQPRRRRRQKIMHPYVPKERQPGDPIYNNYIIYGTLANALLLWIGAFAVLIVALTQRADLDGAETDDFTSLGNDACRVINATTYSFNTKRIDARHDVCVETWEYTVQVLKSEEENENNIFFIPAAISSEECRASCNDCLPFLYGPNYYDGLGEIPSPTDNNSTIECFAPKPPIEQLSTYYKCGRQRQTQTDQGAATATCYMLYDPSDDLEEDQFSVQISLIITYVCFGVGFLLLLVVWFFISRNKREAQRAKTLATPPPAAAGNDDEEEAKQKQENEQQGEVQEEEQEQEQQESKAQNATEEEIVVDET